MTSNMTRLQRAYRWRTIRSLTAATLAVSSLFCAAGAMAQVKAPPKTTRAKPAAKPKGRKK